VILVYTFFLTAGIKTLIIVNVVTVTTLGRGNMKKNYIGIREARINLSRLIRDVRGGMEIIITDRGTPVARLVPAEISDLSLEERLKNFESCGLIESCPDPGKPVGEPVELPENFLQRCTGEESPDE